MIFFGGFKAASDLGATKRWVGTARARVQARALLVKRWWAERVLRKKPGSANVGTVAVTLAPAYARGVGSVSSPWVGLSADEKVETLKIQLHGLRGLVDRNSAEANQRLDALGTTVEQLAASIDARLKSHEVRDESILAWELSGGACALLGTVLALIG